MTHVEDYQLTNGYKEHDNHWIEIYKGCSQLEMHLEGYFSFTYMGWETIQIWTIWKDS